MRFDPSMGLIQVIILERSPDDADDTEARRNSGFRVIRVIRVIRGSVPKL